MLLGNTKDLHRSRTINLCLRWGSAGSLTQENREHLASVYEKSIQQWLRWIPGWDGFPYDKVDVKVVAWAANDTTLIEGPTDAFDVYTGFHDTDGLPTCNPGCSRELHQDGDYSGCPGGADRRFHQYLVLSPLWGDYNMGAAASYGVDLSLFGWKTIGSQGKPWPMPVHEFVSKPHLFHSAPPVRPKGLTVRLHHCRATRLDSPTFSLTTPVRPTAPFATYSGFPKMRPKSSS
jgi:hypothetical protein